MTPNDAVAAVAEALESLQVPYMLVGSYSSSAYGIPRSTQDADFVVQLGTVSPAEIAKRLGDQFFLDPQMSFEGVTSTHRFILHLKRPKFKIELFMLSDDPFDHERFQRRRLVEAFGRKVCLPSPEDVIIMKLHWARIGRRGKDIDDVRSVISVQRDRLDWPYIERWCDTHGTRDLLEEIRSSLPDEK